MSSIVPSDKSTSSVNDRMVDHNRHMSEMEEFEHFEAQHTSRLAASRIRSASRWSKEGRPYEYAIQMPAWVRDSSSTEELFAEKLNLELVEIFGTGITAMCNGRMDMKHGYIKVAASIEKLEEWAEEDGLRIRAKPWLSGGYKAFSRQRKLQGKFVHPGCDCVTAEDCTFCCGTAPQDYNEHPEACKCLLLLPYQSQQLVRSRIEQAFDNLYRDRARQEARAKNCNIMVTREDVRKFLIKFCEHGNVPPHVTNDLLHLFRDIQGDDFQMLSRLELSRLVTPTFGEQMTAHLFDAIQNETKDDIVIPPGQGLSIALREDAITQLYPLHTLQHSNDLYPTRRQVLKQYCTWMKSIGTCMIFGKQSMEYLNFVRDYLGEKIALYFAFLHYYTTWLVPLAIFGTPLVFTQWTSDNFDSAGVIVYCVIVALWSTIMLEFWSRKNAQLAWLWDMAHFEVKEEELEQDSSSSSRTQDSLGFYEKHGAWVDMREYLNHARNDGKQQIERFVRFQHRDKKSPLPDCLVCVPGGPDARLEMNSWLWRLLKQMASWSVISCALVVVVFLTLLLLYLRLVLQDLNEVFGGLIVGSINAVMITIFDYLFEGVAVQLTNFENHRTATRYEDQLIAKQFVFQFVNSYFSLFYIAFFKGGRVFRSEDSPTLFGREDRCKDVNGNDTDSCMAELAFQLTAMLVTRMFIGNLMEYWAPHAQFKANMWKLWYGTKRSVKDQHPDWSNDQVFEEMRKRQNSEHFTVARMQTFNVDYVARKQKEAKEKHPDWSEEKVQNHVHKHLNRHIHDQFDAAEKQAYQAPYNQGTSVSGTFYDYAELAIQFGYVTIFAPAFPLAPLVAIISNVIEHRQVSVLFLFTSFVVFITPLMIVVDVGRI